MLRTISKPWREAASVIIATRTSEIPQSPTVPPVPSQTNVKPNVTPSNVQQLTRSFDYKLLFLTRHKANKSFANADVFPGGVVDDADFHPKWLEIFDKVGIKSNKEFGWKGVLQKPRPPLLEAERDPGLLPNDIAFRLCSIREAFEESGILLLSRPNEIRKSLTQAPDYDKAFIKGNFLNDVSEEELLKWRKKVYRDADQFWTLCKELDAVPNIWSLLEWSHFVTPSVAPRRFDTIYYLCAVGHPPQVHIDNYEMVDMQWFSPAEAINKRLRRESNLNPPQEYECLRLMNLPTLDTVEEYGIKRINQGTLSNFSVIGKMNDSVVEVFPGDDIFPEDMDPEGFQNYRFDESEEENTKRCENLHRVVHGGDHDKSLYCNVTMHCGQLAPQNLYTHDMQSHL